MSRPFYLKCMGVPELLAPSGRPVKIRGHRHLALLVYLVVERRAHYRRDELATLLWPDATISEARHSLSTGVYAIRRALGSGVLSGDRELVRFDHTSVQTDLERLLTGAPIDPDVQPVVEVDGFLRDFEIRDAPDFARWKDVQHLRVLPQVLAALLRLIDHARRIGSSRLSGELADRLRALDPLSEAGTRAKMEALAFSGDRISALRVFEEWSERLKEELGATPGALVEEMARRLRHRGLERPVNDPTPAVQTEPWRDRPFVGRAHEHRQLYERWEQAQQALPRHFVVEGESGIGKSTLVERFAMAASLEGAVVARTQCYELERELPFVTISGLVKGLLDKPGVGSTAPAALAEVARVVPRLRERFPGLPAPMDHHGELARLHFAEGVMAMLEAVMEEHPVVLVVDDFHLADEVSLLVLHMMLRRQERGRFMVLLTMRTSELAPSSAAARIHGGGEGLRMEHMVLPPLSEAECDELLTGLVPSGEVAPTPAERHLLLQAARGVPMVLQLLVQDWSRHGGRSLAFEFRSMTSRAGGRGQPDAEGMYGHLVERVLADLDPVARLVMFAASVLGSRINDLGLYQVADLTTSQTMMGMAALAQRRILRDSPAGLDFVNELVRGKVYTGMPRPLRLELHRAIARRLLARLSSGEELVRGLDIAWHLVRGELAAEAAPHLLRGAREAIRDGAPHEAEVGLISALAEPELLVGASRWSAMLLLAEIQQEQSRWAPSLQTLAALPIGLDVAQQEQQTLLTLIGRRHTEHLTGRHLPQVVTALIDLARNGTIASVRATAVRTAAGILDQAQERTAHAEITETVADLEMVCTASEERADLLTAKAAICYHDRDIAQAIALLTEAVNLLEEVKLESSALVNLIVGMSALACAEGRYEVAIQHAERAYKHACRLDHERLAQRAANNLALAFGRLGQYSDQLQWAKQMRRHMGSIPFDQERLSTAWMLGTAQAMVGDRTGITTFREVLGRIEDSALPWVRQTALLVEADILQLLGQTSQAIRLGREGTTGEHHSLHTIRSAGLFARWVVKVGISTNSIRQAERRVKELLSDFVAFDLLDEAEIYLSLKSVTKAGKRSHEFYDAKLRHLRAKLPPTVEEQWERLGYEGL